jgi:hypothetical protein
VTPLTRLFSFYPLTNPFAVNSFLETVAAHTKGGLIMVEVTEPAITQIAEYFKGKEVKPIRVFLNEGG